MKLRRRYLEKPWGRKGLPPAFDAPDDKQIGEVWFTNGAEEPLLAKYIFTSERLSIQVHPNDEQARARGFVHGKTECWYILEAQPGSTLALGLKRDTSAEGLRTAVEDGSIEELLDWKPVRAGEFYFIPAGTIHAIGEGLSLLEFQQNADITYRLYDYGRPRELHVDDGIAVATRTPYPLALAQHVAPDEDRMLVSGPHFRLAYSREDSFRDRQRWVLPLDGTVQAGSDFASFGECLVLQPHEQLASNGARMLIGAIA